MKDKTPAAADPEKKKEYGRTKRENEERKRAERRSENEEGRTEERRLAFLANIYKTLGYTQETFAEKCGISPQLMSWYMAVTDDCNLTRLEQMLGGVGLGVRVRLEGRTESPVRKEGSGNGVRYRIEGSFENLRAPSELPGYVTACTPDKRLYFLREFIEGTRLSLAQFARRCGIDSTSIRYYFSRDDVKVSVLYKIAKANGADIVWSINPKDGKEDGMEG